MFSKRRFRRNKPRTQNLLDGSEQQKEAPFVPPVQTKLNIGKPGDAYEVEADKTADEVVNRTADSNAIQKMEGEEEEVQTKALADGITPFVQKQEVEEEQVQTQQEEEEQVQAQEEEEEQVQAQEEEEEQVQAQEEEEEQVQAQEEEEEQVQAKEEEEEVQTKADSPNPNRSARLEDQLSKHNGTGNTIKKETRLGLEAAFGADFSGVRIHTDESADQMNRELHSKAFTRGNDIYFRSGNYDPNSKAGKHLLAHELTHTIQQGAVNSKEKQTVAKASTNSVQREKINYRSISWDDFDASPDPSAPYDAGTYSALSYSGKGILDGKYNWNGKEVTATVAYDSSKAVLFGIMDTDKSWKRAWLTDDKAAKEKVGEEGNIEAERNALLAHEQVHFRITDSIAKKYAPQLRAAIPTETYMEKGPADSKEAALDFLKSVMKKKAAELKIVMKSVIDTAESERKKVQEIYDSDTEHSEVRDKQQHWEENYDKALEDAIKRATSEEKSEEVQQDE